jgi:lysophospholipase L1-like esterase
MAFYTASAFRNSGRPRALAAVIGLLLCESAIWAQASSPDRIQSLERQLADQKRLLRDWGGLIRYGSDNSELRPPAAGENRVVFLGDQITDLWGRGSAGFFPDKPWLNRGIAGQTTDQMLVRFRQDVIDLHANVVVILAGLNDIAGIHGTFTEEMTLDNLKSMTELAHANGIRAVLASVTPVCDCYTNSKARQRWQERITELNELIRKYCARGNAGYLDYYSALSDEGNLKKELTSDGVLPNDPGYIVMARLAEQAVAEALKK